ncbi:MAG: Lipopolysaccharide biosynthesis protein WzxC [Syntrophus sp. PtaU1.Bin005]|jgi:PST family polysaccharide transporter|nr:MAG: Lipopolysaccharide biosynthesis protein WzxC [Syntrophus sp. PtaU1.Bin005]
MNGESITTKIARSVKWSALTEVVSRVASPLIFVILARILTPEDFGVMATAMVVISFAQMFWDAGLGKTLIQINEACEDAAHVVFWTCLGMSIVIYFILFLASPSLAVFFDSPDSVAILRVLGLQIILAALSSTPYALFARKFDFHRLFWIKLITAFVPGFISIPLALQGYGIWALVIGTISGQVLNLALMYHFSSWYPRWRYNFTLARKMFQFGMWVFAESFGGWLIVWGDSLIVGHVLGVHDLGIYRTGWMVVTIIFGIVLNPLLPVIYPAFSRLQDDWSKLTEVFFKTNRIIMALALPIGFGLLVTGPYIATLFFGPVWKDIGITIQILGLTYAASWMVSLNHELYRGMGKPDVNTKLIFFFILYYLPSYYIAAQHGLTTFLCARLIVCVSTIPIHAVVCMRVLNISFFYLWTEGKKLIFISTLMSIAVVVSNWSITASFPDMPIIIQLMIMVSVGFFSYIGLLTTLDKVFVLQTSALFHKAVHIEK